MKIKGEYEWYVWQPCTFVFLYRNTYVFYFLVFDDVTNYLGTGYLSVQNTWKLGISKTDHPAFV